MKNHKKNRRIPQTPVRNQITPSLLKFLKRFLVI